MNSSNGLSRAQSVLWGALAFGAVSVAGFAVWAFGGRWLHINFGEGGLYAASAAVFAGLSGALLSPLIRGERRVLRFYKAFVPAFLGYAVVWSACWFALKFGAGEWLGSLAGCAAFAWIAGRMLGSTRGWVIAAGVLFAAHSAGYFSGSFIYDLTRNPPAFLSEMPKGRLDQILKLSWGLAYGLGFGAGIGFAFHAFQTKPAEKSSLTGS